MTIYEGETIRLKAVVTDFNDVILTDTDVTLGEVGIFNISGAEVVRNDLTWDATLAYWYYDWVAAAGAYKAKFRFVGDAFETFEYHTIRVKTDLLAMV